MYCVAFEHLHLLVYFQQIVVVRSSRYNCTHVFLPYQELRLPLFDLLEFLFRLVQLLLPPDPELLFEILN